MFTPFENAINTLSKLSMEIDEEYNRQRKQTITCKDCKSTLEDFMDTGFVGCSKCYDVFKDYAREFAFDVHGRAKHIGKVPKSEVTKASKKRELERLIKEKEIAVKNEDYLLADEYKARIARLREEIKW